MKETYESKMYCVHEHPFAYVTLTDFGEGKGLLQIHSDWGSWSNYWGAMGKPLREFLVGASDGYVHNKMTGCLYSNHVKKEAFGRLDKFFIQSWPKVLTLLKQDVLNKPEQSREIKGI